jgi:hypothetical protein
LLKSQVEQRVKSGDAQFSESLELMIFLANLVGSEHIERFIPMAEAQNERPLTPVERVPEGAITGTREMPKFVAEKPRAAASIANSQVVRVERKGGAGAKAAAKGAGKAPPKPAAADRGPARGGAPADGATTHDAREQVIADAVRLVQWGRKWFELPELVARMAGRPPLAEVRRILKENKSTIDEKAKN